MLIQWKNFTTPFFRENVVRYFGPSDWAIQSRGTFDSRQPPTFHTWRAATRRHSSTFLSGHRLLESGATEIVGLVVGVSMPDHSVARLDEPRLLPMVINEGSGLSGKVAGMNWTLTELRDGTSIIRNNHNSIRSVTCLFIIHSVDPYIVNKPIGYRACQGNTNGI